MFTECPSLGSNTFSRSFSYNGKEIEIEGNATIFDFYCSYPDCPLEVYFSAPLSPESLMAWDQVIGDQLSGFGQIEKVNILLEMLQYTFPYQLDEKQFGREKYMFAEEAIFYPYTDCEDRSVLLAQLIRHYTEFSVIGLDFPQHIAIGVAFGDDFQGDFVTFKGEKYFVCDPTYLGAKAGVGMGDYTDVSTILIKYN